MGNNTPKEQLIKMAVKAGEISKQRKEQRITEYNENPNRCLHCNTPIPYDKRHKKFCNQSCAATYNNKKRISCPQVQNRTCVYCGKLLEKKETETWHDYNKRMYCNHECKWNHDRDMYIEKWKNGELSGMVCEDLSERIRKYLIDKSNNKCSKCGWGEINQFTGKVPLEIHHKDGNPYNNEEDNLEVLCPNCHSLTKSFRGNRGNGRASRRKH